MLAINQMIAGIEFAVRLHDQIRAAAGGMDTGGADMRKILCSCLFNVDHKDPPHIAAFAPLTPDINHETSPVIRTQLVTLL